MKATAISTLLVAASLSLPIAVNAQSAASDSKAEPRHEQYGAGGSKSCDQLTGTKKDECLQDEGAKTDRREEPAAAAPESTPSGARSPAAGQTAPDAKGDNAAQKND